LERLQQFDPAGVFARDLKECLTLQLRDRNRVDPVMQALLDQLPLLAARNVAALVRVCRVDAADVAEMISEIKSLDSRPGLAFDPPLAQPVVPDILMRAQPDGGWVVELNAKTFPPRVLVNNSYYARVRRSAVLLACGANLDRLRREVLNYVNNELGNLVAAHGDDAKPTAGFQRILQRAAIHVQSAGAFGNRLGSRRNQISFAPLQRRDATS
jgi:hypothetical protein